MITKNLKKVQIVFQNRSGQHDLLAGHPAEHGGLDCCLRRRGPLQERPEHAGLLLQTLRAAQVQRRILNLSDTSPSSEQRPDLASIHQSFPPPSDPAELLRRSARRSNSDRRNQVRSQDRFFRSTEEIRRAVLRKAESGVRVSCPVL